MGSIGPLELLLIFLAVLLLFGAKRIPEIARGLGKGIREFKDATSDIKREFDLNDPPEPQRRIDPPPHAPAPRGDSPAQRQYQQPAPHEHQQQQGYQHPPHEYQPQPGHQPAPPHGQPPASPQPGPDQPPPHPEGQNPTS